MLDIISELSTKFEAELQNIKNSEELENIRVSYLGKKGSVTAAMKEMGKLSAEEKKADRIRSARMMIKRTREAGSKKQSHSFTYRAPGYLRDTIWSV